MFPTLPNEILSNPAQEPSDGLPDLLRRGLKVIFCGINPGRAAHASGHHFDGRGNRFWRVMYLAGFTPQLLAPRDDCRLLTQGYGLTTVVGRSTARADQVKSNEYAAAADKFVRKIRSLQPTRLAFLGKPAYAAITCQRQVAWGLQRQPFADAEAWVLPNPSGLNRAFTLENLVAAYRELLEAL
jgi:TDG/mug DNA glycosylase family protein